MQTVENILTVYRRATPEQVIAGTNWYPEARALALELDPYNLRRAAGVIAAFSPRMPWWRNIVVATRLFDTGIATGSTKNFNATAQAIFDGADPLELLGQKTRNFYLNIIDPWNPDPITIDAHALDIAINNLSGSKGRPGLTPKRYAEFSDAYRTAALQFNVLPNVMQAITWVTWRDKKENIDVESI
jgi:hypothetical protein